MPGKTYPHNVVVVGAGVAAARAAQTLRSLGYNDNITLVSAEDEEPYNLPPLSKEFLTGALDEDDIRLYTFAELEALDIKLVRNAPATGLDTRRRVLHTARVAIPYDNLIIATGSVPIYPAAWPTLDRVMCLRTLADARSIRTAMTMGTPRVAIIGGGFVGCEIASSARSYGLETTMIEGAQHILHRTLSPTLAEPVNRLHAEHGVRVECGKSVRALLGDDQVQGVELDDGTRVYADLVVVSIGARPAVDWLVGSTLAPADGVVVDATLQSSAPGVYAVGDVARWPSGISGSVRIEHWNNANEQGALAARNLLDPAGAAPFTTAPYVWSDLHGQRLHVVGHLKSGSVRFLMGEPGGDQYLAASVRKGRLVAGVGFGLGKPFAKLRRFVERNAAWPDVAAAFGLTSDAAPTKAMKAVQR